MLELSAKEQHECKAKHNSDFFNTIETSKFPDWAVVVLFYRGIHLIESCMANFNIHSNDHSKRKNTMNDNVEFYTKDMIKSYIKLERLAHRARYKPEYAIDECEISTAQDCLDEIKSWYDRNKNT